MCDIKIPKHFLTKLVEGNFDSDVHRKMVKYGKGTYPGPGLNATFRGEVLRLYGDFEYEYFIGSFFLWNMNVESLHVDGKVFSRENRSDVLNDLGIDIVLKKSKQLYETQLKGTEVSSESLRKLYVALNDSLLLLSARPLGERGELKTKIKIPKPSLEESEKRPSFCSAAIPVSDPNDLLGKLVHLAAPDFSNEVDIPFSSLKLNNRYEISNMILPENKDRLSAGEIRLRTLRKGKLRRTLEIDGKITERESSFTA